MFSLEPIMDADQTPGYGDCEYNTYPIFNCHGLTKD